MLSHKSFDILNIAVNVCFDLGEPIVTLGIGGENGCQPKGVAESKRKTVGNEMIPLFFP